MEQMQEALSLMEGTHNFKAFCRSSGHIFSRKLRGADDYVHVVSMIISLFLRLPQIRISQYQILIDFFLYLLVDWLIDWYMDLIIFWVRYLFIDWFMDNFLYGLGTVLEFVGGSTTLHFTINWIFSYIYFH